jgi:hypothetical protein
MPIFFPDAVDDDGDDVEDDFPERGLAAAGAFAAVFDVFATFAAGFFVAFAGCGRRDGVAAFFAAGFFAGAFFLAGAGFFAAGFLALAALDFRFEVAIVLTIVLRRSRVIA